MGLSIVVAMDNNGLIGKDNQLPWHLPADLAYFKKITTGKSILMGRKTYDSIGRPLPNRRNIVITRNTKIIIPECEVVSSIDEALLLTENEKEVMVIGGASLCEQLLPRLTVFTSLGLTLSLRAISISQLMTLQVGTKLALSLTQRILQITTPIILLY